MMIEGINLIIVVVLVFKLKKQRFVEMFMFGYGNTYFLITAF